ncbi:hypothetical protein XMIN_3865 [Xanthomonas citri pv. mangiferaeindicae LMG 941]|nr:hypothetical protein XMIN_3865 [Xanthomonas citri pv. mangiferaeindicae LMG 941]
MQRCIGLRPVGRFNKSSPVERAVSSPLAGHAVNPSGAQSARATRQSVRWLFIEE